MVGQSIYKKVPARRYRTHNGSPNEPRGSWEVLGAAGVMPYSNGLPAGNMNKCP